MIQHFIYNTFLCDTKGLLFNVLNLTYADSSPICQHVVGHGTQVRSRPFSVSGTAVVRWTQDSKQESCNGYSLYFGGSTPNPPLPSGKAFSVWVLMGSQVLLLTAKAKEDHILPVLTLSRWSMHRCLGIGPREVSTRQLKLLSWGGNDKGTVEYSALAVAPNSLRFIRPILQHDPAPWVSVHTPSFLDISSIFKSCPISSQWLFFLRKLARVCFHRTSKLLFYSQFLVYIIKSIIQ